MKHYFLRHFSFFFILCFFFSFSACDYAPAVIENVETTEESVLKAENQNKNEEATTQNQMIYVHVCGCVKKSGLYSFPAGSRADAAVKAAGGFTKDADQTAVNLAEILEDGAQLNVPSKGDEMSAAGSSGASKSSSSGGNGESALVNINTATVDELTSLSGIGEGRAKAIIEYRDQNGLFQTIEDIKNVSGIGDGIYDRIKSEITV